MQNLDQGATYNFIENTDTNLIGIPDAGAMFGGGGNPYLADVGNVGGGDIIQPGLPSPIVAIETPTVETPTPQNPTPNLPTEDNINYEIALSSNLQNEIGDKIKLKYEIRLSNSIIDSGDFLLSNLNTDNKSIRKSALTNATLSLFLENSLSSNYTISNIYYTTKQNAVNNPTDYSKWKVGNTFIGTPASDLLAGGIAVAVIVEKELIYPKPVVSFDSTLFTKQIKDSDTDGIVNINFKQTDCNYIDFYLNTDKKIRIDSAIGFISLSFKNDFEGIFGNKKIIAVPYSDLYGTGDKVELNINFNSVNDFPSVTEIIYPNAIDIPSFSDLLIDYDVSYTTFATSYVDVDLLLKNNTKISLFKKLPPNGSFKINIKELATKFAGWNGNTNVTLIFKPINKGGAVELQGNDYEIKTELTYPSISLSEDIIKTSIFYAFIDNLNIIKPEKESKYLTHLANFGNDNEILISSFEEDNWTLSKKSIDELGNEYVKPENVVESLILKLYNPLPNNISNNSTFWITKLLSNPLIETVVLNQQDNLSCPPLKGPNFNIEIDFVKGQSTSFESLDTLILSSSISSSSQLVSKYLSSSLVNLDDLNIEYTNNETYVWENFIHFSSAKERVDNFVYKVQLIEKYEELLVSASTDYTNSGSAYYTASISAKQEIQRQQLKKDQLINGFDGFEKFLYTSSSLYTANDSSSFSWPYDNTGKRILSTSNIVSNVNKTGWYDTIIDLAKDYDINNENYVLNNIPQYIINNEENDSLLLFFCMIGQHFDNIYFHTKAIEKTRKLGYKAKDGISDKLLFDVLKSFNWDAKNLASDSKLWEYVFGLDSNGNTKQLNPAKQRTYEVWRRIVNNLPYLLKHKGTRRGIYALMSCYGIPSSNLSILEFGGPEVTEEQKGKLVMDNITTALKMVNGSFIEMEWKTTNKGTKPNSIELFVKPKNYTNSQTLISGSNWNLKLDSLTNSDYGNVSFYYDGSNAITSSLLPIFNGRFFGISISSGSTGLSLSVKQVEKERTIFEETITGSNNTNWNNGSTIRLGGNYSGSVDEFRLWSEPLNSSIFFDHVSFPEMINGNSVSSSIDDLYLRLDFEYPKNLYYSSSLLNVANNINYPKSFVRNDFEETGSIVNVTSTIDAPISASAIGFATATSYPHQFEAIDRTVVMPYPDGGASRFQTQKVRFEEQTLVSDLSVKHRSTKKAFDQAPTDSNRVGLFFSPTKELNIDIAKSFGGLNIDNYIGDPSDDYKPNYSELDVLRHYYFERHNNRDIYEYINLIKLYEKSMFEDIKKMLPARVKATTGLLIEPHFLERSKVAHKKPTGDDYQLESEIKYSDTTITLAENNQYETIVNVDLSENLFGENNQYETTIHTASIQNLNAENYQYDGVYDLNDNTILVGENNQYEVDINAQFGATIQTEIDVYDINTIVGQSEYESIGFGLFGQNGYAIRTFIDKDGIRKKQRVKVDLIKEQKERIIPAFAITASNGMGDLRGGFVSKIQTYTETKLNIQPYSGSKVINTGTGSIVEVTPLQGYLPTHYRNTSDLTTGLKNSYYLGSKNTAATTLDGTPPIEVYVSNPNTLTVNKTGRNPAEPILEVE